MGGKRKSKLEEGKRKRKRKLELQLPEAIIQRIQSFLTGKEAARTTILSKSWHSAWLTRPNIDLNDSRFNQRRSCGHSSAEFSKYAKKTLKRYEQSNLKIDSLKLCMKRNIDCCGAGAALVKRLIVKALGKLGATRLNLRLDTTFVLPCEVVFGADNHLVELSVQGCTINANDDGKVIKKRSCSSSRLKSLYLDGLRTTRDGLSNVISSCPSIENLSLSNIIGLEGVWSDDEFPAATAASRINNFDRLKCLVLCHESYKALFAAGDLLSEIPFLTDLTLTMKSNEKVQISNCSLERIHLELEPSYTGHRGMGPMVHLDVPSIRKFTFVGGDDIIPSLSFVSPSTREWESHVSIKRYRALTTSWFRELNEFLAELRQSKTHLSLRVCSTKSFDYKAGDVERSIVRKHELESLTIDMMGLPSLSCHALLDGLFRLCRPKLITLDQWKTDNLGFLCEVLEQGMLEKVSFPRLLLYGLNDLEEVSAQVLDEKVANNDVPQWRPIPLSSLRDLHEDNNDHVHDQSSSDDESWSDDESMSDDEDSEDPDHVPHQGRYRFWLKWKPFLA